LETTPPFEEVIPLQLTDGSSVFVAETYYGGILIQLPTSQISIEKSLTESGISYNSPCAVALPDGKLSVFWIRSQPERQGGEILGQVYDALGFPVGDRIKITAKNGHRCLSPQVAARKDGSMIVVYGTKLPTATIHPQDIRSIQGTIVSANGALQHLPKINPTGQKQSDPQVIAFEDGRFLTAWADSSDGQRKFNGQFFRADGTLEGAPFSIASPLKRQTLSRHALAPLGGKDRFVSLASRREGEDVRVEITIFNGPVVEARFGVPNQGSQEYPAVVYLGQNALGCDLFSVVWQDGSESLPVQGFQYTYDPRTKHFEITDMTFYLPPQQKPPGLLDRLGAAVTVFNKTVLFSCMGVWRSSSDSRAAWARYFRREG
jgi:hypothetical protein